MSAQRVLRTSLALFSAVILGACTAPPRVVQDPAPMLAMSPGATVKIDETAMLPLLGYFQLLLRMTPQELTRERSMLMTIPQTPATQTRMSMLLGLTRAPADLARAQNLLDALLKSTDPAAISLFPLARLLSSQYNERQKNQMQNEKQAAQSEQLGQQLKESQRRSAELQEKLDALATIERSLPVRSPPAASGGVR